MKAPEETDWLAFGEQQFWFDRYKCAEANGLRFNQFQEFLVATVYQYFANFPKQTTKPPINYQDKHVGLNGEPNQGAEHKEENSHQFSRQQEMRLFKSFDAKNDHVLDRDEFGTMCLKWLHGIYKPSSGLVIVDVQNDFIDGSLALINGPAKQDGGQVVPVINELIDQWQQSSKSRATIVYTQDWHPADHIGFHANLHMRKHVPKDTHPRPSSNVTNNGSNKQMEDQENESHDNKVDRDDASDGTDTTTTTTTNECNFKYKKFLTKVQVFDTVLFDEGRLEQKLWPIHCVQNSWGAQLHPKLRQVPDAIRIQKGTLSHVDAYSAFWDNMRLNETGLRQELLGKRVGELFFCGLALDFCVSASALDAARAGFVTYVIEDACRGIDEQQIEARKRELLDSGVFIVQSCHVKDYLMMINHGFTGAKIGLDRDFIKTVSLRKALVA